MLDKEYFLDRSNAVRTFCDATIHNIVNNNFTPLIGEVEQYYTDIKEWLSPVIDLSHYHVYPTNGITEGLNYWMATETRSIIKQQDDYVWVNERDGVDGSILYMSSPSSINGNYVTIPNDIPVALDLAYVGSALPRRIDISNNVEYVFFSLSKCFGLGNIRTGWMFTREPFAPLELLINNAKYYNYPAHHLAEQLICGFDIDYIPSKFKHAQEEISKTYDFTPTDVVWLVTTKDPYYDKFKHGDTNRICIAKEIRSSAYV